LAIVEATAIGQAPTCDEVVGDVVERIAPLAHHVVEPQVQHVVHKVLPQSCNH
jgi:hypothetical protein